MSIADITQSAPPPHQYNTQPPPPGQPHPMAQLGHPVPHHSPQYLNREREMREREREMREQEMRDREMRERDFQRHQELMAMRDREARDREREEMERLHREQQQQQQQQQQRPVQSHAGSIPIHQPVASKVQNSIHGPNGLLSNGGAGPPQPNGLPQANASSSLFGAPTQHEAQRPPQFIHQQVGPPQQSAQPFMAGPSPMPGQAQLAHGQQPILNVCEITYITVCRETDFILGCAELSRPSENEVQ